MKRNRPSERSPEVTIADRDLCFDNLCGSHLQSQSELYQVS